MDLNQITEHLKSTLSRDDAIHAVDDIDEPASDRNVLGIETADGHCYFITVQLP